VNGAVGRYERFFADAKSVDPASVHWITQLENILSQSYTEQSLYDFKQGFLRLDGSNSFDDASFERILQTCVAIANVKPQCRGYVLVGVAESAATATRVSNLFGADARPYSSFYITGVDHDAAALHKSMDQFFQMIVERVKAAPLSEPLKSELARHIKPVRYYNKTVFVFEVNAQADPSHYGEKYFVRAGTQVNEVQGVNLGTLFRSFARG
jgi:hypothetical protein